MEGILKKICDKRLERLKEQKSRVSLADIKAKLSEIELEKSNFIGAIESKIASDKVALIAEIKKQSPSKGLIRADFNPSEIAKIYSENGAACISVLTEEDYFAGNNEYLKQAASSCNLPIIRKDFILDEYQIYEAKSIGASAVLLIVAALEEQQMQELEALAHELKLDVLVEVHDESELQKALKLNTKLVGVNNRNLKTLEVSLNTSKLLSKIIPDDKISVCESGIFKNSEIKEMQEFGYNCFLVGESLMREANIAKATKDLLGL